MAFFEFASGKKLKETVGTNTTDYVGNVIYKNGVQYQISHDEGRIINGVNSGQWVSYQYNASGVKLKKILSASLASVPLDNL